MLHIVMGILDFGLFGWHEFGFGFEGAQIQIQIQTLCLGKLKEMDSDLASNPIRIWIGPNPCISNILLHGGIWKSHARLFSIS